MILETARLVASRPTRAHFAELAALFSDPRVNWDYAAYRIAPPTPEAFVERCDARFEKTGHSHCVLHRKDDGVFVGMAGLAYQDIEGESLLEVGYRLLFDAWKKGYATEAALAFRDRAFAVVGVDQLIAIIRPDNRASIAVAERVGMTFRKMVSWKMVPEPIGLHVLERATWNVRGAPSP